MTLTSFESLQKWYQGTQAAREETSPHWNLYGTRFGETEKRVAFNTSLDDAEKSFTLLAENVRMMNNPDGATFRVQVFPKGKPNNPTGNAYIQIFEKSAAGMAPASSNAAISGLPPGVGSIQEYIDNQVETRMLRQRVADLETAMSEPNTGWERAVETISGIPGIDKAIQALVAGLVTKFNPAAAPAVQAAMAGMPANQPTGNHDEDDENDPETMFANNIQAAANRLQTDPLTLAKKINALVQSNPDVAKQLLNG